jgi:CheY-like chemotaxis protein
VAKSRDTTGDRVGDSRDPSLLVVDREPAIRTLLAKALPPYGLEVVTAAGFSDAAEAIRRRPGDSRSSSLLCRIQTGRGRCQRCARLSLACEPYS